MTKSLLIPAFTRAKQLASVLRCRPSQLMKDLFQKKYGKLYVFSPGNDGSSHFLEFQGPKDVIIPYSLAAQYAASRGHGEAIHMESRADTIKATVDHLKGEEMKGEQSSTPVCVLLGHFNHVSSIISLNQHTSMDS